MTRPGGARKGLWQATGFCLMAVGATRGGRDKEWDRSDGGNMKWLDLPPIWLAGFLALAWTVGRLFPDLAIDAQWLRWLGAALALGGIALMLLAIRQMAQAKTTVVPHRDPSALVTSGVFRYSRNPIYLGDALILTGAILWWGTALASPLIPIFMWVIGRRFIAPEEARLKAGFAEDFTRWSEETRRWL